MPSVQIIRNGKDIIIRASKKKMAKKLFVELPGPLADLINKIEGVPTIGFHEESRN